mgnify:CR=1 FL=1
MKTFYVYRLTCTHPESPAKYYYGYHSCIGDPRQDPYWSSSRTVQAAMIRFGPEAFTKKIIAVYPTRAEALALEVKLHHYFNVKDHPLFFNRANQTSTKFTTTGSPSMATRAKIGASQRGKVVSDETRAKIAEAKRGKPGKPASPETKAKMAEAQRQRWAKIRAERDVKRDDDAFGDEAG